MNTQNNSTNNSGNPIAIGGLMALVATGLGTVAIPAARDNPVASLVIGGLITIVFCFRQYAKEKKDNQLKELQIKSLELDVSIKQNQLNSAINPETKECDRKIKNAEVRIKEAEATIKESEAKEKAALARKAEYDAALAKVKSENATKVTTNNANNKDLKGK